MLFEELVWQHRVHRLVAHDVNLTVFVARHQIGVTIVAIASPGCVADAPADVTTKF